MPPALWPPAGLCCARACFFVLAKPQKTGLKATFAPGVAAPFCRAFTFLEKSRRKGCKMGTIC